MARFLVAAVQGDFINRLDELVRACGLRPSGAPQFFKDWSALTSRTRSQPGYLKENVVFACHSGNWTILSDDGFVGNITDRIFRDKQLGQELSRKVGTPVVSALGDDTTCEYGFRLYRTDNPRYVLVREGVEENIGDPAPGEPPVRAEDYTEEDVLTVLKQLGIDIEEGMEGRSALLRFDESLP